LIGPCVALRRDFAATDPDLDPILACPPALRRRSNVPAAARKNRHG
jgi:hypothetical protein